MSVRARNAMSLSSLPRYPVPLGRASVDTVRSEHPWLTPRSTRVVIDVALLAVIVAAFYWLRLMSNAIEHRPPPVPRPAPLDFGIVEKDFGEVVSLSKSRQEAERLLGPPTQLLGCGGEMAE